MKRRSDLPCEIARAKTRQRITRAAEVIAGVLIGMLFAVAVAACAAADEHGPPVVHQETIKAVCGPKTKMAEWLKSDLGFTSVVSGVSARNHIATLYLIRDGGWVWVLTGTDGISCMVDGGDAWNGKVVRGGGT